MKHLRTSLSYLRLCLAYAACVSGPTREMWLAEIYEAAPVSGSAEGRERHLFHSDQHLSSCLSAPLGRVGSRGVS